MTFAFASIFSGIGGFESGIAPHGGECVFASEIDKFARTSYEALYGVVPQGDISQIASEDIPHHDLLVGGPPCQAFSVAGNKSGMRAECSSCGHQTVLTFEQYADREYICTDCYDASLDIVDDRGLLFFEMARIAKDKKPKAILIENVKGLVRHDKGHTLRTWLTTLSSIGYALDFEVLNSVDFNVAQTRERVYIVGLLDEPTTEWDIADGSTVVPAAKKELINDVNMFNFDWPSKQGVYRSLRSALEDRVDENYFISEDKTVSILREAEASQALAYSPVLTPERVSRRQCGPRFRGAEEPAYTVTTQDRHGVVVPRQPEMVGLLDIRGHDIIRRVYDQSAPGPTVTTMGGGNREPKVKLGDRIRKLTPLECWRLQGFTDEQFYKAKNAGLSNSQLYKQAGNAVTVNVIDAIMQNLKPYVQEDDLIDIF